MEIDFDINKTIGYWLEGSIEDLDVSKSLYNSHKYSYSLFFGHLALEKLLKSIYVKNNKEHAPVTHSLPLLVEKSKLLVPEEYIIKLKEFMEFYFEGRYPIDRKKYIEKCDQDFTKKNLDEINKIYQWLKNQL